MSCDFAVWSPRLRLSDAEALIVYQKLCEGLVEGPAANLPASPSIDAFYTELTGRHPEIDSIADDQVGDHDLCPWSCAIEHADTHIIMNCVWSKAKYVEQLVGQLAAKHSLALFDPQAGRIAYPGSDAAPARRPWWKPW